MSMALSEAQRLISYLKITLVSHHIKIVQLGDETHKEYAVMIGLRKHYICWCVNDALEYLQSVENAQIAAGAHLRRRGRYAARDVV